MPGTGKKFTRRAGLGPCRGNSLVGPGGPSHQLEKPNPAGPRAVQSGATGVASKPLKPGLHRFSKLAIARLVPVDRKSTRSGTFREAFASPHPKGRLPGLAARNGC
jgi:hypothetical protein